MQKVLFIVNPFSGTSNKSGFDNLVSKTLDKDKLSWDIQYTQAPDHATELAMKAKQDNLDYIIAVGGDGTVNEIAKVLTHSESVMGVLPAGSGNGFAMHLGLGRNIKLALEKISKLKSITIDTCSVNDHFYINVAGAGFDALIANRIKQDKKRGFQAYLKRSLQEARSYKNGTYTITYNDKKITSKFLSVNVANASMFGYNFTIAPQASLQDQVLDLVMIKDAPKYKYILSGWRFLNQSIDKSTFVEIENVREVTIESKEVMPFHIDGEGMPSVHKLDFKIDSASLKILVP